MTDDELLDQLSAALDVPDGRTAPPADRITRLRTEVALRGRAVSAPVDRPVEHEHVRWIDRSTRWAVAVAACLGMLAGAIGTVVGLGLQQDLPGRLEYVASAAGAESLVADAQVRLVDEGRVVTLSTDELPILPTGELYEVWFVAPDDTPDDPMRISAGTFHPDAQGRTQVQMLAAADPSLYPTLVVTAEPGDADPAVGGPEVLRFALSPA